MAKKAQGKISDEAVRKKTGKGWAEWFEQLDDWGAADKGHKLTARYLKDEVGISAWWAQMVTVEYERGRGLREVGERTAGSFAATAQRTIRGSVERAFDACVRADDLAKWLTTHADEDLRVDGSYRMAEGARGRVVKLDRPSMLQVTWDDPDRNPGTTVTITFEAKGDDRVIVRLRHDGLKSSDAFEGAKRFWRSALDNLRAHLQGREAGGLPPWSAGGFLGG